MADQAATSRAVLPVTFVLIGVLLIISFLPALCLWPVKWFVP